MLLFLVEGVSILPCAETYCGPSGGSEPETQATQNEFLRLAPTLAAMITIHSYGNMWMFPWGNTINYEGNVCERSDDYDELVSSYTYISCGFMYVCMQCMYVIRFIDILK